jgi:hypothetical protein
MCTDDARPRAIGDARPRAIGLELGLSWTGAMRSIGSEETSSSKCGRKLMLSDSDWDSDSVGWNISNSGSTCPVSLLAFIS